MLGPMAKLLEFSEALFPPFQEEDSNEYPRLWQDITCRSISQTVSPAHVDVCLLAGI